MADLHARTRLALATAARESADLAYGIVTDLPTTMVPGERIRTARRVRLQSFALVDRAVLVEKANGASWEEIAAALSMTVADTIATYGDTYETWLAGEYDDDPLSDHVGGLADEDVLGTAQTLDAWWKRHVEPWHVGEDGPVTRAVTQVARDDGF